MEQEILFIHSAGLQDENNGSNQLVTYLRKSLRGHYKLIYPQMPHPDNPRYISWKNNLSKQLSMMQGDIILVGHSLGGSVILKYLAEQTIRHRIIGLFLLATPYWGEDGWNMDEFILPENFEKQLLKIEHIFLYHSQEDAWVPFKHMQKLSKKIPHAVLRPIDGDNHEFTHGLKVLVEDIRSLMPKGIPSG